MSIREHFIREADLAEKLSDGRIEFQEIEISIATISIVFVTLRSSKIFSEGFR